MGKIQQTILRWSKKKRNRVALGVLRNTKELREHLKIASKYCDVICVGKKVQGFESYETNCRENATAKKLISLYTSGKVDGFMRGHIKFSNFYEEFKKVYGTDHLEVVCLMQNMDGREYGLGPGIMGYYLTAKEKLKFIETVAPYLKRWGVKPKIGLTGKDFFEDGGYSKDVDKNIAETKKLYQTLKKKKYDVEYYAHIINEACAKSDFVVAIDGTYGNYLYRTLLYMGGAEEVGELLATDINFTENSRYNDRYSNHLIFTNAVVNYNRFHKIEPKVTH